MADDFEKRNRQLISKMAKDSQLRGLSRNWFDKSFEYEYCYHFTWMGRPIIQYPQDVIACQEIVWKTKPDCIIEMGIARGGSLIFWASMLELCGKAGRVLGVDVDIRTHNRQAVESHPMFGRIEMIEGSSLDETVAMKVKEFASGFERVMVVLDSMHTHEHVARELELYADLVTSGCYLLVFDTVIEDMPEDAFPERPWGRGDNPKTALHEFLAAHPEFEIDREMDDKLLISAAPNGYLVRVK